MYRFIVVLTSALLCLSMSAEGIAQDREWAHDESIVQISEHVYRFGSDNQYGAYILTDEGIIVIDGHYCGSPT
jgi:hypothetical protein